MTKAEFGIVIKSIRSAYNRPEFLESGNDKNLWYEMLKDVEYTDCVRRLKEHIQKNKFLPTIAEIRGPEKKGVGNFGERNYDMIKLEQALLGVSPSRIEDITGAMDAEKLLQQEET